MKKSDILGCMIPVLIGSLISSVAVLAIDEGREAELDDKTAQIIQNLNEKELQEINEILAIEGFTIDLKNDSVSIIARVDAETSFGEIETLYSFKFDTNAKLIEFARKHADDDLVYDKSYSDAIVVSDYVASMNVLDGFISASEGEVIDYKIVNKDQQEQLSSIKEAAQESYKPNSTVKR